MRSLFWAFLALLVTAIPATADRAVVVGVNSYPSLRNADLRGCLNDAQAVQGLLESKGFSVTLIPNGTREQILETLRAEASKLQQNENFVFYFSGHGTGPGEPRILTHSSLHASPENDVAPDELNQIVKAYPCKTKTIILDSCFSGAMMKAIRPPDWQSRYYPRAISRDLTLVNKADQVETVSGQSEGVCYFVASRSNEEAIEASIGGTRHGVFTYYLTRKFNDKTTWGNLQSQISSEVITFLNDRQHPTLSPKFQSRQVFGGSAGGSTAVNQSLWDIFNTDSIDKEMLQMTMNPNKTNIRVGERLTFDVKAGAPGYLIIAERGTSGRVNLIHPLNGQIASAKVQANQTVKIPGGDQAWAPDDTGSERLRAFLFRSPEAASELLGALTQNKGLDIGAMSRSLSSRTANSKDLKIVGPVDNTATSNPAPAYQFPYYTSDIHFLVIP